ncbi:MAG: hypothetical protein GY788_09345 [bacterium]|nr:hypothetical protein [bacterium]
MISELDGGLRFAETVLDLLAPRSEFIVSGHRPSVVHTRCASDLDVFEGVLEAALELLPILSAESVRARLDSRDFPVFEFHTNRFGELYRQLSQSRFMHLQDEGGTLFIEDLEHVWAPVDLIVRELARHVGSVWSGLFVGWGANGYGSHWDDNYFVSLQIYGEKTWTFSPSEIEYPSAGFERYVPHGENRETLVARPGDIVAVGRGVVHSTQTTSGPSAHLMIARRPPLLWEVLSETARALSAGGPEWRRCFEGVGIDAASELFRSFAAHDSFPEAVCGSLEKWT